MKRAMFSVLTLIVLAGLIGCAHHGRRPSACMTESCAAAPEGCQPSEASCDDGTAPARKLRCRLCSGRGCKQCCEQPAADPGPAVGAITYPYYTNRGPRDFLARNPGSIGP